ncbi:MAG TPA: protein kinase [Bryobacteraceae bacterium]|nr:protein kinase [Bryobacteraceae bacterium]
MTEEQWRLAWRLCQEASGLSGDEREAFLSSAEANSEITRQVRLILDESTMARIKFSLGHGAEVGRYKVLEKLGEGGMGEVYSAEDTELGRRVALKFLLADGSSSPAAAERFIREARAASALNHPNIVTVYEVVRSGVALAIAMELVEGISLRELCRHKLPVARTVVIGRQIAEALSATHSRGIVHRDVKPENIMIRPDGYLKVLDFGLARMGSFGAAKNDRNISNSLPAGTWRYMSPEQTRGEALGPASDIYSLGLVLYEMCTGTHPFPGQSPIEVAAAIASQKPPRPSSRNPEIPTVLEGLLGSMLQRQPEMRPTAEQVARTLQRAEETLVSPARKTQRAGSVKRAWVTALILLCLAGMIAFVRLSNQMPGKPAEGSGPFRYDPLSPAATEEAYPSISADGSTIVYSGKVGSFWHILERRGTAKPVDLTRDSNFDNTQPAISADGRTIAFRSGRDGGGLFLIDASGANLRKVSNFGYNPAWSPDAKKLVFATEAVLRPDQRLGLNSTLWTIAVASGQLQQISSGDAVQPCWSPDGKRIAFWKSWTNGGRASHDIWTIGVGGGPARAVTSDGAVNWSPKWSPDGRYLYYLSDRRGPMNLWRVRIDEETGAVLGQPEPQTTPAIDMSVFSLARSSERMVYENRITTGRIVKLNLQTGKSETLVDFPPSKQPVGPDLSPDGRWVTFYSLGSSENIYIVATDGTHLRQLTEKFMDRGPRWSPNGRLIAFRSSRSGRREIWTIHPDGTNLRQVTNTVGPEPIQPVWSPDGTRIAYNRGDGDSAILDLRTGVTKTIPAPGFQVRHWSADGSKLLGQTAAAAQTIAPIIEYDLQTGRTRQLGFGNSQVWAPDGRSILFSRSGELWKLDTSSRKQQLLTDVDPGVLIGHRASADMKLVCLSVSRTQSELWMRYVVR